jgi:hypothetical protein
MTQAVQLSATSVNSYQDICLYILEDVYFLTFHSDQKQDKGLIVFKETNSLGDKSGYEILRVGLVNFTGLYRRRSVVQTSQSSRVVISYGWICVYATKIHSSKNS